jgi:sporulation protein YlmC with PRC-barrel domain
MEGPIQLMRTWIDKPLYDADQQKIGTIDEIYYDETTGRAEWLLVKTGLFGTKKSFVPALQARASNDRLSVPYSEGRVKDAPRIDKGDTLTDELERQLYAYYDLDDAQSGTRRPSQCLLLDSTIMLEAPGEEGERLSRR